jgi:hypothetical protein
MTGFLIDFHLMIIDNDPQGGKKMRTFCKITLASAALAFAALFADAASAAPAVTDGGPDQAYCLNSVETGSPWCGYSSYAQCEATASGTGADCVANVWRDERPTYRSNRFER